MRTWKILLLGVIGSVVLSGCSLPQFTQPRAALQVITPDISASLFLDDQYLEKTPFLRKDLAPKTYTLKIVPDEKNLAPYETSINLSANTLSAVTWKPGDRPETSGGVTYELERLKGDAAELAFISIPDRALVSVDEGETDFAPLTIENISAGEHTFRVTSPTYDAQEHSLHTIKGYRLTVSIKLAQSLTTQTSPSVEPQTTSPLTRVSNLTPGSSATGSATGSANLTQTAPTSAGLLTGSATITIKPTNFFQDGTEVLRARSEASVEGDEVGFAQVGKTYPYLGEQKAGWYKIMLDGQTAWVSGNYTELTQQQKVGI